VLHHPHTTGAVAGSVRRVPRALAPGCHLLFAFQVGDEPLHPAEPFGHPVSLDFHRWSPDRVTELPSLTGLVVTARLLCEPDETERVEQTHLLARKPKKP
jgi:hypothetical protein